MYIYFRKDFVGECIRDHGINNCFIKNVSNEFK